MMSSLRQDGVPVGSFAYPRFPPSPGAHRPPPPRRRMFGPLQYVTALAYTQQIVTGLVYLHANNVIHRSLAPPLPGRCPSPAVHPPPPCPVPLVLLLTL